MHQPLARGTLTSGSKRHLAQEKEPNSGKSEEEVKKTKSYASLKNWGHDFLKGEMDASEKESQPGQKRKTRASQVGSQKRHEPEKGGGGLEGEDDKDDKGDKDDKDDKDDKGDKDDKEEDEGEDEDGKDDKPADDAKDKDATAKKSEPAPAKGDTVSWKWGAGHPKGTVLDVKPDK